MTFVSFPTRASSPPGPEHKVAEVRECHEESQRRDQEAEELTAFVKKFSAFLGLVDEAIDLARLL